MGFEGLCLLAEGGTRGVECLLAHTTTQAGSFLPSHSVHARSCVFEALEVCGRTVAIMCVDGRGGVERCMSVERTERVCALWILMHLTHPHVPLALLTVDVATHARMHAYV